MYTPETWQPVMEALGWTLIHFTWQGTLVALLLAGVLRILQGWSTNARYAAGCAALLLMVAAPLAPLAFISLSTPGKTASGLSPVFATLPASPPLPPEIEPTIAPTNTHIATASPRSWLSIRSENLTSLLPWMILFWLLGVIFFSLRLVGGWLYTQRLKSHGTRPLEEKWQQTLRRLCGQLRVMRPVRLLESALVKVPTVIGWLRPVILLPVGALTGLMPQQMEAIIAHELAHIRRHDYLINLLQAVIETLLFYHPAVWWVSRRIRQEREHCCDDLAVAVCGDALTYARALLEMEQLRAAGPQLAVAANGGLLMNRIQRLVGAQTQHTNRFTGLFAGIIALTTVVSVGAGAQILLQSSSDTDRPVVSVRKREARKINTSAATPGESKSADADQQTGPVQEDRAAEALLPTLQSTSWDVRKAAVERLAQVRGNRAVEFLIAALKDDHVQVREQAAIALGRANNEIAVEPLLKVGATPDRNDRPNLMANQQAAAESMNAMNSSNPTERAAAACSLGKLGAVEAISALINLLGDDTPIEPIKCWDSGNWSPALHTLKQASPGEQAAIALASLSQPAIEPLVNALGNGNPSVRRNAAWAIGEIRGGLGADRSAAVEPLIAALSDGDSWVRVAAAFSLGEIRPREAKEPLVAALGDAEWNVREMAARALGEMKARSGVESLTAMLLRDENERVRRKAAWALGEIRDPQALDALTIALADQDQRVRATVKWAISEIRD